jgi:predicted protein tyrosine phosphatase
MQIKVTNRGLAEVLKFDIPYIVISIYSTGSEPANLPKHPTCLDVLSIHFDDLAEDITTKELTYLAITEQQANQIWTFIANYNNTAELILIHCDVGVCRSPAVAAAISKVYTGEDRQWFEKPYLPNMKVYNTMLKVKGLSNEY